MNKYNNSDSDDEDHYLDDNDPDFIEFKENVKLWIKLDDDISTLTKAIKDETIKGLEDDNRVSTFEVTD